MHRQLIDRCYCAECGAETQFLATDDTEHSEGHVRCCRYCGSEVEVRQPASNRRVSALHCRTDPAHTSLGWTIVNE